MLADRSNEFRDLANLTITQNRRRRLQLAEFDVPICANVPGIALTLTADQRLADAPGRGNDGRVSIATDRVG